MTFGRWGFAPLFATFGVAAAALPGCGGGGTGEAPTPSTSMSTEYRHSVAVGLPGEQKLLYRAGTGSNAATVFASTGSTLLPVGVSALVAEHDEPQLPGMRIACVSGKGESINVVTGINAGVIAESAAVLLDDHWQAVDANVAWSDAATVGAAYQGWENCGIKPEGPPSPSSRLVAAYDGSYTEDVYDGNPGTTFSVIRRIVTAADVDKMLAPQGATTTEDPLRPLVLTLRAWRNDAGRVVFVETGVPTVQAPAEARGFIALYIPTT